MTFTTPCFVRVDNTEERCSLINWCFSLKYPQIHFYDCIVIVGITQTQWDALEVENMSATLASWGMVDCGTNVELFKALAAMNVYNDCEQWFTDGIDWCLCHDEVVTKMVIPSYALYHKATVAEIIEHFKNR